MSFETHIIFSKSGDIDIDTCRWEHSLYTGVSIPVRLTKEDTFSLYVQDGSCREYMARSIQMAMVELRSKAKFKGLSKDYKRYVGIVWRMSGNSPTYIKNRKYIFGKFLDFLNDTLEGLGYEKFQYLRDKDYNKVLIVLPVSKYAPVLASLISLFVKYPIGASIAIPKDIKHLLNMIQKGSGRIKGHGIIPVGLFLTTPKKLMDELTGIYQIDPSGYNGISTFTRSVFTREAAGSKFKKFIDSYGLNTIAYREFGTDFLQRVKVKRKSTISW